ncbi:hypothetical protein [Streptacidiphilus cavernicola]|uniref:Reversibly glycosylated polypeptide n=1 Tax=Streptacidiphilus cavernicola TaxID=3342716 RepID=A0ABV6VSG4_9ACTN
MTVRPTIPTAIVTTTIRVPYLLRDYLAQFDRLGHPPVSVYVVGDRKSPATTREWIASLPWGEHRATYLDVEDQERWNARIPALRTLLPWNSIQRRNLGYLVAALEGAERIISIDDDNHVTDADFLAGHALVGATATLPAVSTPSRWANPSDVLVSDGPRIIHRGYPTTRRETVEPWTLTPRTGRVVVNAGLWVGEPDVDAISRIAAPAQSLGIKPDAALPFALDRGTYGPFNSQNTAFHRDLLPAAYLVVMGPEYRGVRIDRYDDIWMSYFTKALTDHLGDLVAYGGPLVRQDRNDHDLLVDLWGELPGMVLTERLVEAVRDTPLTGGDYLSCYRELIEGLRSRLTGDRAAAPERDLFTAVLDGMDAWADICQEVTTHV